MIWSPQQASALDAVSHWMQNGSKEFMLHGYAGTGKTELARHFAEGLRSVYFATFTGKAALVLQGRGCPAQTIHSLFYSPLGANEEQIHELLEQAKETTDPDELKKIEKQIKKLKAANRPRFAFNPETPARDADLLVIDEGSMVSDDMAKDILGVCKKVLFLGDPAQLPPVRGTGYFMSVEPDATLTEIHRQAADNPILKLATMAREGRSIPYGDYGLAKHVPKTSMTIDELATYDQIITGFNKTRMGLNKKMRKLRGYDSPYPVENDRLICLRNNRELGLLNGLQGIAAEDAQDVDWALRMHVDMENVEQDALPVWKDQFDRYHREVPERLYRERRSAEEFDFAYAITAHKAQGSAWDRVAVCDDGFNLQNMRRQWLYTAITRAREELCLIS